MHAIRKKYAYNHVHDATLLQTIEGPMRCTCTKRRDSAFSHQFGIIPQLNDAEQQHRLGIH